MISAPSPTTRDILSYFPKEKQGQIRNIAQGPWGSTKFKAMKFSYSVVSDSLRPHGLQHTRLPCPSLTPGACSNPCPSSWWCHPTILSSVVFFSSCLQSFPASEPFPMSQFFTSFKTLCHSIYSLLTSSGLTKIPESFERWSDFLFSCPGLFPPSILTGPVRACLR